MADVTDLRVSSPLQLQDLKPGECFVCQYDWNKNGQRAQVWMKVETRHYNPSDEQKPKVGFMTVNLRTGINGGQVLNAPVFRVQVKIEPILQAGE